MLVFFANADALLIETRALKKHKINRQRKQNTVWEG
jgi:hypothetical protein